MAFNELLSSSFLFSIAIIIILIGGVFAYVSYRMSEQDHKITSMLGLITAMAEELQFFRSNLSQPELTKVPEEQTRTHIILDPNNLVAGQSHLISVSDDEDNVSEDEDEDDEDDEDTDVSEDDDETDDDEVDEVDEVDLDEICNIKSIHLDETCNIKSIHLEEPIDLNVDHSDEHVLDHSDEHVLDLQSLSIADLEETDKKPDYKKWSLTKLKEVIVEKGIVADASKLKKNDILKLLGVE